MASCTVPSQPVNIWPLPSHRGCDHNRYDTSGLPHTRQRPRLVCTSVTHRLVRARLVAGGTSTTRACALCRRLHRAHASSAALCGSGQIDDAPARLLGHAPNFHTDYQHCLIFTALECERRVRCRWATADDANKHPAIIRQVVA